MRTPPAHLSIPSNIPPRFSRPLIPGCPTDNGIVYPPWTVLTPRIEPHTSTVVSATTDSEPWQPNPQPHSVWRIEPGTFIAFALDTEAIAAHFPTDSIAQRMVLSMPVGRYVGLVSSCLVHHVEDADMQESTGDKGRIEELVVNYVAAVHPPIEKLHTHALPLHPASNDEKHALVLHTDTLLPWKDRVVWTTLGTRLQITEMHESGLNFNLDQDMYTLFDERQVSDYPEMTKEARRIETAGEEEGGEQKALRNLQTPLCMLPAKVWRDVREADGEDPLRFALEVEQLIALTEEYELAADVISE
ncbi:hypothetical protein BDW22DRAFT_1423614 [Trametopsis cervina]|nr:hypothetical protein BDW22DRAFT_1423614 [Trametopsis cervina]